MMVRLFYRLKDGFEGVADRPTYEEARALVNDVMADWTIFELTEPGRYAQRGRTLADIENPSGIKDSGGGLFSLGDEVRFSGGYGEPYRVDGFRDGRVLIQPIKGGQGASVDPNDLWIFSLQGGA